MSKKPKIAVIGLKGLPAFGGAASVGGNIIEQLKRRYHFTVYSIDTYTDIPTGKYEGFNQIVFKGKKPSAFNTLFYYIKSLFYVLFIHQYDLIHLHHAESGFITPFLKLKYKVVVTFHGIFRDYYIDPKFSKFTNHFFKVSQYLNIKFSDEVISVSTPDARYCIEKYNRNMVMIPNGISIIKNVKYSDNNKDKLVFAAARIYAIKGLHLLLEAMILNNDSRQLLVIGDLEQMSSYKKRILKLSKNINIQFLGLIKNRQKLFENIKGSYQFIFPSLTEAMSMMLLEVVSLKVPVLASNIAANRSIFSDDEITFFESNNISSLSTMLLQTSMNQNEINTKAEKAFNKLKRHYSWKNLGKQYDDIFARNMS